MIDMKKYTLAFFIILCSGFAGYAQNKKLYGVFENKILFQQGLVQDSAGNNVTGILRFAPFVNYTIQAHKDFGNKFGIYTGVGIKNVGFILKYDTLVVKSRAYCLSVPLGIKFGNMDKETYFYAAGEFLAQIDYKEKVFLDGDKSKRNNNNDINKINYSAMVGFNMKAFTVGLEYTLNNFYGDSYNLVPEKSKPNAAFGTPSKSNILTFFIGFRTNLSAREAAAPEKKQLQQARLYQY
ncbi:hypothetical protein CHU_3711 [Cytophaga hutchinsonii ATCC 33406]|uniref:Outer membrane protein beta-barrel domain-containing protein n=2 Tax=Cytophaga hutchinsonii TaxID=985 RepID=A0A6N4SX16_CYTH3|nr:hypothetical protein CHU_3711 [Cytophaga hutchinsonii ATCC 33406]